MQSILMAIRPPFSGLILEGKKTAEIRKSRPMFNPRTGTPAAGPVRVYIYETKNGGGAGAIVGRFDCYVFMELTGNRKKEMASAACLTAQEIEEYAAGRMLYGWKVANPKRYKKPVPLVAIGTRRPPQSWQWLNKKEADTLKRREKNNVCGRL